MLLLDAAPTLSTSHVLDVWTLSCCLVSTPQVTALGLFKEALIAPIIAAAAAAASGGVPAHLAAEMKPFVPDSGEPPRVKQEQVGRLGVNR